MPIMGHAAKWAFQSSSGTPSTATMTNAGGAKRFLVVSDSMKKTAPIVDGRGIAGTRGRFKGRARIPRRTYSGTLVFELSPEILQYFIAYMMHDTSGSTPFELAETIAEEFDFQRSDGALVFTYRNCIVTSFSIKGASGGMIELTLNISAKSEATNVVFDSAYTLTTTTAAEPMISGETIVSLSGNSRHCDDFELTVDHGAETKHRHSIDPTDFLPGMRTVSFSTNTVWGATEAGLWYGAGEAGFAAAVSIGATNMQAVFTLTNLVAPDNAPSITGPGELLYGMEGIAKGNLPLSSMKEISVTVDSAP